MSTKKQHLRTGRAANRQWPTSRSCILWSFGDDEFESSLLGPLTMLKEHGGFCRRVGLTDRRCRFELLLPQELRTYDGPCAEWRNGYLRTWIPGASGGCERQPARSIRFPPMRATPAVSTLISSVMDSHSSSYRSTRCDAVD